MSRLRTAEVRGADLTRQRWGNRVVWRSGGAGDGFAVPYRLVPDHRFQPPQGLPTSKK